MANCVQCGRQLPGLTFGKRICQWCKQHEAAQRGEDSPVQRVEAAPWLRRQSSGSMLVTQLIFGANAAVFLAMSLAVGVTVLGSPAWNELGVRIGANVGPYTLSGQWWRLLTAVFIHGGLVHFAFNMWCLWSLGRLAESVYGHWTFAIVYLICGLSASVTSIFWNTSVSSVGASGAIFGIAGALLASFYLGEFSLPRAAISGLTRSVGAFVGYNLLFGAAIPGIDNAAHVGGLIMGLILGALIAKAAPAQDQPLRRVGVLLVGVLLVVGGVAWLRHSRSYVGSMAEAEALLTQGKTTDAIAQLDKVVRQHPNYWPAHLQLARAYTIQRDPAKAEVEFKRVIQINPRYENAYFFLGYNELESKRPDKAQEAFAHLLKLHPNSADAHAGMAAALSAENKYAQALDEYKQTIRIDPDYQSVHYNMGLMQEKLGLDEDAIQSFLKQRAVADDPDNETALASMYEGKGMKQEADDARERAKQFDKQQ